MSNSLDEAVISVTNRLAQSYTEKGLHAIIQKELATDQFKKYLGDRLLQKKSHEMNRKTGEWFQFLNDDPVGIAKIVIVERETDRYFLKPEEDVLCIVLDNVYSTDAEGNRSYHQDYWRTAYNRIISEIVDLYNKSKELENPEFIFVGSEDVYEYVTLIPEHFHKKLLPGTHSKYWKENKL